MVDHIKLNHISGTAQSQTNRPASPKKHSPNISSVTISTNLRELAHSLIAESQSLGASTQVLELKSKIENHQYKIDIDELAGKLSNTLIGSKLV